jgi:hypothetical protein
MVIPAQPAAPAAVSVSARVAFSTVPIASSAPVAAAGAVALGEGADVGVRDVDGAGGVLPGREPDRQVDADRLGGLQQRGCRPVGCRRG